MKSYLQRTRAERMSSFERGAERDAVTNWHDASPFDVSEMLTIDEIEMVKSVETWKLEDHYFVPCSPKSDRRTLWKNSLWKYQSDLSLLQGKRLTMERKRNFGKNKPLHLSEYESKTEKQHMRPLHRKNKIKCSWSNEKVALPKGSWRRYSLLAYNNTWKHCQDGVCDQMTVLLVKWHKREQDGRCLS